MRRYKGNTYGYKKIYKQKIKITPMNKEEQEDDRYKEIVLKVFDVINLTEDQFLRLSSFPNFGHITVQGTNYHYKLADIIKTYNPDLYNKYKLLIDEFLTENKLCEYCKNSVNNCVCDKEDDEYDEYKDEVEYENDSWIGEDDEI